MTAPRTLLRTAAMQSLAAAAAQSGDSDFAPLVGAQLVLGAVWPTQAAQPGASLSPASLLLYGWEEKSESKSGPGTAPQYSSVITLVIEGRIESNALAANSVLPAEPGDDSIAAAVDSAVDALAFAVKKAVNQYLHTLAVDPATGLSFLEEIRSVVSTNKFDDAGQRVAGQGVVAFELVFTETFEPLIENDLNLINALVGATAGGIANQGNVGNGTIGNVLVGLGAIGGAYNVALSSPAAFSVTDPNGAPIGTGTVGVAFAESGIGFTITAGDTPFIAGDGFTVTIQALGSYQLAL